MKLIQKHSLPIFLSTLSIIFALVGDSATSYFQFERDAILDKEVWRLFTCHLVHSGWSHLWLNITGLLLVWTLTERWLSFFRWWAVTLLSAFFLALVFLFFMPEIEWYMGLSGLLHAMFAAGAAAGIKRGFKEAYLFFAGLLAKIVWEQTTGSLSSDILCSSPVLVDAHLYGALCGTGALILILLSDRFKISPA